MNIQDTLWKSGLSQSDGRQETEVEKLRSCLIHLKDLILALVLTSLKLLLNVNNQSTKASQDPLCSIEKGWAERRGSGQTGANWSGTPEIQKMKSWSSTEGVKFHLNIVGTSQEGLQTDESFYSLALLSEYTVYEQITHSSVLPLLVLMAFVDFFGGAGFWFSFFFCNFCISAQTAQPLKQTLAQHVRKWFEYAKDQRKMLPRVWCTLVLNSRLKKQQKRGCTKWPSLRMHLGGARRDIPP